MSIASLNCMLLLFSCMYVCGGVYVCDTHTCVCRSQRDIGCPALSPPLIPLKQSLLLNLKLGLHSTSPSDPPVSLPQGPQVIGTHQ